MDGDLAATYTLIYSFLKKRSHNNVAEALRKVVNVKDAIIPKEGGGNEVQLDEIVRLWRISSKQQSARTSTTPGSSKSSSSESSSSDSDSDSDSNSVPRPLAPVPSGKNSANNTSKITPNARISSPSSSDTSNESASPSRPVLRGENSAAGSSAPSRVSGRRVQTVAKIRAQTVAEKQPVSRRTGKAASTSSSSSSSSSDDDESEEEEEEKQPSQNKKQAKAVKSMITESSNTTRSSDSDSDSDEAKKQPQTTQAKGGGKRDKAAVRNGVQGAKERAVGAKQASVMENSSDSESSESSSTSSGGNGKEMARQPKVVAPSTKTETPASRKTTIAAAGTTATSTTSNADLVRAAKKRRMSQSGAAAVAAAAVDTLSDGARTASPPARGGIGFKSKVNGGENVKPKINERFKRVDPEKFKAHVIGNNDYDSKAAPVNDYGRQAHQDLIVTRGAGFRKEKSKKKRGSYRGGVITMESHSFKFAD